jgi:hypothetical protein
MHKILTLFMTTTNKARINMRGRRRDRRRRATTKK